MISFAEPPPLLFQGPDVREVARERRARVEAYLCSLASPTEADFDDLLRDVLAKHGLSVPRLRMEDAVVEPRKTTIDARRDPNKVASVFSRGPVPIPGWAVTVRVPFDGNAELFKSSPPRFTTNPPRAFVKSKALELRYEMEHIDAAALKARYEGDLQPVREWLSWQEEAIGGFNDSLAQAARGIVATERHRQEQAEAELAKLGIAVKAPAKATPNRVDVPIERNVAMTARDRLTGGEDPKYSSEGAPWTTPIPEMKEASETEVALLGSEGVDVLVVVAVEVERDAVLREMKPPREVRRIRRAHVGRVRLLSGGTQSMKIDHLIRLSPFLGGGSGSGTMPSAYFATWVRACS